MKNEIASNSEKARILVVDDEEVIRDSFQEMLETMGFEVENAKDFVEAKKLLQSEPFDTVLTDIMLPGVNGMDLLKNIREIQPDTPVIMITGAPSVKTATNAVRLGAYDYLCKPVTLETLLNVVKRAVGLKALRDEKKRVEIENQKYQKNLESLVQERAEKLKESEKRYRKLFEYSKDPMYVTNEKGKFIYMNQATIGLFEYSREEMVEMNLSELFAHPSKREQFQQELKRTGSVKDFETELLKKNGTMIEGLLTSNVMRNNVGKIVEYQGIIRDITPNKRAADKIREQDQFLKYALDSLSHPFLVINAEDYTVKMANSAANPYNNPDKLTCYSLTYGRTHPCSRDGYRCPVEDIQRTKKPVRVEHLHNDRDGNAKNFEIHGFPLFDDSDNVAQVICYQLDITEREEAKRELQLLSTAIEQSAESIIITDIDGIIQYVNPAFEFMTAYSRDEAIGQNLEIFQNDLNGTALYEEMWETVRKGKVWHGNFDNKKKDDTAYIEDVTISPVKGDNGEIVNYVAVKRDVTEKRRLETIAEAANLMDNIGYIFSGIRHEIGNPLNSAKMALTVLSKNMDTYSKETVREFVERTLEEMIRVEFLLKALKNFSLFERPDVRNVQMDSFIENLLSVAARDFEKKGITIKTALSPKAKWGLSDPRALQQVMLNLLINAADALDEREDARILIRTRAKSGLIQISVEDNGCGMSEEGQENLFRPFFTSKAHGTGLGLVIVKKMLSKMNSTIGVESQRNIGTRVTVSIPKGQRDNP